MSIRCRRLPFGVVNVLVQFTSKHANCKLQHEIKEVHAPARVTHNAFPSVFLYVCDGIVTFCLVLVNVRDFRREGRALGDGRTRSRNRGSGKTRLHPSAEQT